MLELEFEFDHGMHPYNFKLEPLDEREKDILYAFTHRYCSVENPMYRFSEDIKCGCYASCSDDEYNRISAAYEKMSGLFHENGMMKPSENIFELFVRLLNYYLISEENKEKERPDNFEDDYDGPDYDGPDYDGDDCDGPDWPGNFRNDYTDPDDIPFK